MGRTQWGQRDENNTVSSFIFCSYANGAREIVKVKENVRVFLLRNENLVRKVREMGGWMDVV